MFPLIQLRGGNTQAAFITMFDGIDKHLYNWEYLHDVGKDVDFQFLHQENNDGTFHFTLTRDGVEVSSVTSIQEFSQFTNVEIQSTAVKEPDVFVISGIDFGEIV